MDLSKLPIFAALKRQMDYLNQRQQVIAQNIANVDTPGYQPRDLKAPSFKDLVAEQTGGGSGGALQPVETSPMHMTLPESAQNASFREEKEKTAEAAPTGNSVKIEDELVKLADAQFEYSTATALYKKNVGLIMIALGKK